MMNQKANILNKVISMSTNQNNKGNLLAETLAVMKSHGRTPADVKWAGDGVEWIFDWETFAKSANDIEYDNRSCVQEIAEDLLVVGKDWWLERSEYNGTEHWVYKSFPIVPQDVKFRKGHVVLRSDTGWKTLAELNKK